jgi:4'-phosphopantetheinyl transferase EntD
MKSTEGILKYLKQLNARAAVVAISAGAGVQHILHADETHDSETIVHPRRKEEFLLGRTAAHSALRQLGSEELVAVRRGARNEPIWPDGFTGSITHCYPWTVVAVARRQQIRAIGIDLENMERMKTEDVRGVICGPAELNWVAERDSVERLTRLFSAKEAIFKALYPLCSRYFDFLDVELKWTKSADGFSGALLTTLSSDLIRGFGFRVVSHRSGQMIFSYLIAGLTVSKCAPCGAGSEIQREVSD